MLGSLYTIDMMCRIEDQRLDFITKGLARARQNSRAPAPHEIDEHDPEHGGIDPASFDLHLQSSFVGSRSYRAEHLEKEIPLEQLDKIVSGEVPPETQPRLRALVLKFMRHADDHIVRRDGSLNTNSRCNKEGRCVWGFPQPITPETTVDPVTERIVYRRRTAQDQMIAQYPPLILLAWEGHAHIDFSVSLESFVYIFKYIHKGPDYVDFRFAEPAQDFEEAANRAADDYIRARYLSATEATWRLMAFDLTSKTPSVARLGVHEPGANVPQYSVSAATPGSDASSLTRYFLRPDVFSDMTYSTYNQSVTFRRATDEELADPEVLQDTESLEKTEPGQRFRAQVVKRRTRGVKVARIKAVRPGAGEIFYIRQLLLHKASSSWGDLKTVIYADGTRTLRFLYCLLIVDGALALNMWEEFRRNLSRDFLPVALGREPTDEEVRNAANSALRDVGRILAGMGKFPAEYGLDVEIIQSVEADVDRDFFAMRGDELRQTAARSRLRFTATQRALYDELMLSVNRPSESKLHLIQGRAGRGKTFVVQAVINQLRADGHVLAVSGATGLSASAFVRGSTVHKMFSIPVVDDMDATAVTSRLKSEDRMAGFLLACSAIIIDEIWALHRSVIEAVDIVMRLITGTDRPFGGKVVFGVGDPRQTAPVVKGGGKTQIIENSFLSSPLFDRFKLHELTDSMRNGDDIAFSDWVDEVGDDWSDASINISSFFQSTVTVQDAQDFLFPANITADPIASSMRAFLSPYNVAVAEFNGRVLDTLPGNATVIRSFDGVKGDVEEGQENLASPDYLNSLNQPGTPPHQLQLKAGALCVVMRNFSAADGLVKNAKVAVVRAGQRSVTVRVLGTRSEFTLPKITFEFQPAYSPFVIVRKQIPLRLAYALTVALLSDSNAEHVNGVNGAHAIQVNNIVYREFVKARPRPGAPAGAGAAAQE
ncbi:unnamed protein product [Tilletia laevis]|nr:unnamed protein product [Tilletia laevis]